MKAKELPGKFKRTMEVLIDLVGEESCSFQHCYLPGAEYLQSLEKYVLEKQGRIYRFSKKIEQGNIRIIEEPLFLDGIAPEKPLHIPVTLLYPDRKYWLIDREFTEILLNGWNLKRDCIPKMIQGVVLFPPVLRSEREKYLRAISSSAPDFFNCVGNSLLALK